MQLTLTFILDTGLCRWGQILCGRGQVYVALGTYQTLLLVYSSVMTTSVWCLWCISSPHLWFGITAFSYPSLHGFLRCCITPNCRQFITSLCSTGFATKNEVQYLYAFIILPHHVTHHCHNYLPYTSPQPQIQTPNDQYKHQLCTSIKQQVRLPMLQYSFRESLCQNDL